MHFSGFWEEDPKNAITWTYQLALVGFGQCRCQYGSKAWRRERWGFPPRLPSWELYLWAVSLAVTMSLHNDSLCPHWAPAMAFFFCLFNPRSKFPLWLVSEWLNISAHTSEVVPLYKFLHLNLLKWISLPLPGTWMMYTTTALWVPRLVATYQSPKLFATITPLSSTPAFYGLLRSPVRWSGKWAAASSLHCLGSLPAPTPPHHNPITCNIKKQTDKTRLLSRESRFLSSLMLNFSSIHVLPRFTLTHLMLPKCNLLFQASKPLHLLVFLPRREFLLFSYPENSYLYFIFFPTRTLNSTICHSQEQLVQPFCPSPVLSEHSVRAFFCVSLRIL